MDRGHSKHDARLAKDNSLQSFDMHCDDEVGLPPTGSEGDARLAKDNFIQSPDLQLDVDGSLPTTG
eukprot:2790096-Karenia_brevis.AAC.1